MKSLIIAVVSAEADPELKKANAGFVESVTEHFRDVVHRRYRSRYE